MYLKALEILGFKSFAERTRLTFEPGMIAIVGPNGCGKSNVSDAIRWVLGEQRPSALRCSKMQDLIFNGTDARKPMGMVEVSLNFCDCEAALGTEYNEVTITRRAFRSGENQYFLNKTPCRLKDIQRLFMGTGVGTTSYSVMAQGQIDAILSSRPEDRRAVFEEAAGVTKFKADRKEALRKIQQTEENLTRVTDILRELKRQSTLLQRQAEKAELAKTLRGELRGTDLYLSKKRLVHLEEVIGETGMALAEHTMQMAALQQSTERATQEIAEINAKIQADEDTIAQLTEAMTASSARHSHAQEKIKTNLTRMTEYRNWSVGLEREIAAAREQMERLQADSESLPDMDAFDEEQETIQDLLDAAQDAYEDRREAVEEARGALQEARDGLAACDRKQVHCQNVLAKVDAGREERLLLRGRLQAEVEEAHRVGEERATLRDAALEEAEQHRETAEEAREVLIVLDEDRSFLADDLASAKQRQEERHRQLAALNAQKELLAAPALGEHSTANAKVLDPMDCFGVGMSNILGPLAEALDVPKANAKAVEIALSSWSDAIVVRSQSVAQQIYARLSEVAPDASLRLLVAEDAPSEALPMGISAKVGFEGVVARLLAPYRLMDTLPEVPMADAICITPQGDVLYPTGDLQRIVDMNAADPLARHMACVELDERCTEIQHALAQEEQSIAELQARLEAMNTQMRDTQRTMERAQRSAAQAEGAYTAAACDAEAAERRLEEVSRRLEEIVETTRQEDEERAEAKTILDGLAQERDGHLAITSEMSLRLGDLERAMDDAGARLSEVRYRMVGFTQKREHALSRLRDRAERLRDLEATIAGREDSIRSCLVNIERLEDENLAITSSLDGMEAETLDFRKQVEEARTARLALNAEREALEAATVEKHKALLDAQEAKNKAEVALAENRLRHQTLLERLGNEYGVTPESLPTEPCRTWEEGEEIPADEDLEARMTTLRAELERIGPVNLLAIEEYKALEERYTFTKAQETDLIASRDELMTLIKNINETSGKMFRETFAKANENFEKMFTRLFHGGEARLVLLENDEDPLECGIDIIAKPPGKKPQTISLLSGGERTMTAVSLLFAIFLIKPAPFCLLDELDAALDDSNIGRFVDALKDFLVHSQFLIITHNQHTIAGSDIVYGVTMPEKGVSRTLSMRFNKG